jgi:hypothetical protein
MEVIVSHPAAGAPVRPVERVRSTLVTSGIAHLRATGRLDAWSSTMDPAIRDELVTSVAGTWLPTALALEYYRGCDRLGLSHDEVVAIGRRVSAGMKENSFLAIKRLATGVGVTPWTIATHFERLWVRVFDGGGFKITKIGPKDAFIDISQTPMGGVPYFRSAFCGFILTAISLVARAATARVTAVARSGDGFTVRIAWV